MKKFKTFFYPIYILSVLLTLYYSIDVMNNLDAYKENMDITFALKKLPNYLMTAFIVLGLLMAVEIVLENMQIFSLKRKLKKAEDEALKYKAKLYENTETNAPSNMPVLEENSADEDE